MHLKATENFWIIFAATLFLSGCSTPGLADEITSHCLSNEEVYFTCLMKNGKTLSLCGSAKALSYRYGKAGNLELIFPSAAPQSIKQFKYNNYLRYGVDYYRVSFLSGQYYYRIYRDIDSELTPQIQAGIIVESKSSINKKEFNLSCVDSINDNLSKLSEFLECDEENALGCTD